MPRQARLVVPGMPLHVVHRANNRQPCFRQEGDYLVYLALLKQAADRRGCAVHAYCLMTNHVHLLVTPRDADGCAAMMHGTAQRYAYYFNRRVVRTGTLWEGRFRSCLVESGEYLLACYRYIELNPIRAGMVDHVDEYPWSSFAGNSGARKDSILTPHDEYCAIATARYVELVRAGLPADQLDKIREATDAGSALGSEAFKSVLAARLGRRLVAGRAGRPRKVIDSEKESVDVPDFFSGGGVS